MSISGAALIDDAVGPEDGQAPSSERRFKTVWIAQQGTADGGAFVFVPAGYGDARVAYDLARGFRREWTILAVQPPCPQAASLDALLEHYVGSLRQRQPRGPYCLGGYSAGGVIALEMARKLKAQGEDVRLVALLDPLFAHYNSLAFSGYRAMKGVVGALSPRVVRRVRLLRILTAMVRDEALALHLSVLRGHRPQPYPGQIHLFQTRTSFPLRPPRVMAEWRAIAEGGLVVHTTPGTHHSFMRPPHVQRLAGLLEALIADPECRRPA